MEKSTQLSCEGEEGASSWLGPGCSWLSWSSCIPSLCLSFPLAGWDTYPLPKFWVIQPRSSGPSVFKTWHQLHLVALTTETQLSAYLVSQGLGLSEF